MALPVLVTTNYGTYGAPVHEAGPFISSTGKVYVFTGTPLGSNNYYFHRAASRGGLFTLNIATFSAVDVASQFLPKIEQNGDILYIVYGSFSSPTWTWYLRTLDMSTDTLSSPTTIASSEYIYTSFNDHVHSIVIRDVSGTKQLVAAIPSGNLKSGGSRYERMEVFFKDLPSGSFSSATVVYPQSEKWRDYRAALSFQGDEDEVYCYIESSNSGGNAIVPIYNDDSVGTGVTTGYLSSDDIYTKGVVDAGKLYYYTTRYSTTEHYWTITGTGTSRTIGSQGASQLHDNSSSAHGLRFVYSAELDGRLGLNSHHDAVSADHHYLFDETSGSWDVSSFDTRNSYQVWDHSANFYETASEQYFPFAFYWTAADTGEDAPPSGAGIYYDEVSFGGVDHELTGAVTQAGHTAVGLIDVYIPADHEITGSVVAQFLASGLVSVQTITQLTGAVTGQFVTLGYGGVPGGTEDAVQHERCVYQCTVDGIAIQLLQAVVKRGRNYNLFDGWLPVGQFESPPFAVGSYIVFEKKKLDLRTGEVIETTSLFVGQVNGWHRQTNGRVLISCSGIAAFPALVSRRIEDVSYVRKAGADVTIRSRIDTRFNPGDFVLFGDENMQANNIVYYINPTNAWMELGHG